MIRVGYPCMNRTLGATTGRTVRLANVGDLERVRAAVAGNLVDLERMLRWNAEHGFHLLRIGNDLIPFASHKAFAYDWRAEHGPRLLGRLAGELNQRLSLHPGQYINPGAPDPGVVGRSLAELDYAAALMDLVGDVSSVIVLHMGGVYGDRAAAAKRFVDTLRDRPNVLRHLAIENDERCWSAAQVAEAAAELGVPMILDTLHHRLNRGEGGGQTLAAAMDRALASWDTRPGVRPKLHISSQDPEKRPGSHAAAISGRDWGVLTRALRGRDADVMLECKDKESGAPPRVCHTLLRP